MFRRLIVEEWQSILTIVSFALFAGVFLVTLLRTFRMPREQVQHLNSLPLTDETTHEH